ncbi:MAG TPA: DUF3300 domain-containing protein [Casimicrobiaceae bacterium]|jgi:hypothetical protein|nr:DUF3300 domain-containing protein [Casimicrobiaceae bacterium]
MFKRMGETQMMRFDSNLRVGATALRGPVLERLFAFALMLMLALLIPAHSQAQSSTQLSNVPPDLEAQSAEYLPQDQLDALLAPIALYPDDLLAQVLMASTYPLEVVEAARFVQQNPALSGVALDDAVRTRHWDPSVQSLTAFPQVLAMMSDRLEWTQQLGDAVLANRQQVMDTVQALRARAETIGTLQDTDQQHVYTSEQAIVIEPAQFDYVYVPVYDPMVVYGPWWVASYQPYFWYPPPYFGYPVHWHGVGIVWGRPCRVDRNHWGWARPEWRAHRIAVTIGRNEFFNRPQYRNYRGSVSWQHAPEHRRGVAYGSARVNDRFINAERRSTDARQELRAGVPPSAPGRQASAPQDYRQRPSDSRAAAQEAPAYRQAPPDSRAASQNAPAYRQTPSDQRVAPALRQVPNGAAPAMSQAQVQPRIPQPSMPRTAVAAPQAATLPPSMPHVIVTTPQAAPAPPPAYAPAPAQAARVVRQGSVPAVVDSSDTGPSRR